MLKVGRASLPVGHLSPSLAGGTKGGCLSFPSLLLKVSLLSPPSIEGVPFYPPLLLKGGLGGLVPDSQRIELIIQISKPLRNPLNLFNQL